MIVSILNQKGGVGKTTLAINLARYFTLEGFRTLLIDSDPQMSAMAWHERSGGELLDVTCQPNPTLHKDVIKYASGYDWIFIDGVSKVSKNTASALICADIVLVPVQPSPYDLWASQDIVELIQTRRDVNFNKPYAAMVVSRKIPGSNLAKDVHDKLTGHFELPIFKAQTSQRVAYVNSVEMGVTVLDMGANAREAANEIIEVGKELESLAEKIASGNAEAREQAAG